MPLLHLLVGPNGSGKSSYARDVLIPATRLPFINADEIAAERWPDAQMEHAYDAAKVAGEQRSARLAEGSSFISETVFSHPSKVQLVADAVGAGYIVHLHVMLVPVELSVQRVRDRIRRGGHVVPEQKIRDRYERLWIHIDAAVSIVDTAQVYDNSSARQPFRLCATFSHGVLQGPATWPQWTPDAVRSIGG